MKTSVRGSLVERLMAEMKHIEAEVGAFIAGSAINQVQRVPGIVILTEYYFAQLDQAGRQTQAALLKRYREWHEHVALLFPDPPKATKTALLQADKHALQWIEHTYPWVSKTSAECRNAFVQQFEPFRTALGDVSRKQADVVLVPDTNALVASTDWPAYAKIAGSPKFTIVILPTVLAELDKLKITHREQVFRDKVKGIITRIKGLRNQTQQGMLSEGVTVDKTITIRLLHAEPDFDSTLSWLKPDNDDDRIIAAILEYQRRVPSSVVVLVTDDINLQNKAEAARLPYDEPPEK
jgi:rRNA-processing protein FCF1